MIQNALRMKRLPALFLSLACWLCAGPAPAAPTDPAQIMNEAYINLVQADQSLDAGRLDEALSQYQIARDYYLQLAKDFPGWEPRIIQYRKTYCDNQIADAERRKGGGQPSALPELPALESSPSATPPAPAPAPEAQAPGERSVEIDYLKSRIASLEAEVAESGALQNQIDTFSSENERLRKELESAKQQLSDRTSGEQTTLASLQAELAAKDQQLQALQKDLDSKTQLNQALNDMEAKANELRAQTERLNQEIQTLDTELDDAEVRADQADLRAKKAEKETQKAEKEAQKARDRQGETEKQLADARRKPDAEPAVREKEPAKSAEPAAVTAKSESKPEIPVSPVKASVPPKPVPKGMMASDYVRRLLQEGDNESALATAQEARKVLPTDMNLVLIEGIALIRLQRYSEAATILIDLAKNNPRNAEIHATLGAAMMGAGFYEEARETLLKAIRLDKNVGGEYYYNLAQLYALVDPVDLKTARRYYSQARNLGVAADPQLEKALK